MYTQSSIPKLDAAGSELMNWLTHLRTDGNNTPGGTLIGFLPVLIIQTFGVANRFLGLTRNFNQGSSYKPPGR